MTVTIIVRLASLKGDMAGKSITVRDRIENVLPVKSYLRGFIYGLELSVRCGA